jgi:hypothetical protein
VVGVTCDLVKAKRKRLLHRCSCPLFSTEREGLHVVCFVLRQVVDRDKVKRRCADTWQCLERKGLQLIAMLLQE